MGGQATIWSLDKGAVACRRHSHTSSILAAAWLSDSLLATAGALGAVHVLEFVADAEGSLHSQHLLRLQAHSGDVNCMSVSADCQLLCTGGDDGTARIWQVEKVSCACKQTSRKIDCYLARAVSDGKLALLPALCSNDRNSRCCARVKHPGKNGHRFQKLQWSL
jgi:WD40 repeat protein